MKFLSGKRKTLCNVMSKSGYERLPKEQAFMGVPDVVQLVLKGHSFVRYN